MRRLCISKKSIAAATVGLRFCANVAAPSSPAEAAAVGTAPLSAATTTNYVAAGKKSLPDEVLRSTIKIYANTSQPNYLIPWQRKQQQQVAGSGFVADQSRRLLFTNAHVVAYAPFVEVRKHGDSEKYVGIILYIGADCDIAVVHVPDDAFWACGGTDDGQLPELDFHTTQCSPMPASSAASVINNTSGSVQAGTADGSSLLRGIDRLDGIGAFDGVPTLQSDVKVAGYPMGGDQISVTSGVVSRIDMTTYGGSDELLSIQLDAAINRGNSGGPALCDGKVIGIAFQTLRNADNIGYVIPVPVIAMLLKSFKKAPVARYLAGNEVVSRFSAGLPCRDYHEGFCTIGFIYSDMQNETLRRFFHVVPPKTGILVTAVLPTSCAKGILRERDVIVAINGLRIANDATIELRPRERVSFSHVVKSTPAGTAVQLRVLREGTEMELAVSPAISKPLVPTHIFSDAFREKPKFHIFGGFVFSPLTVGLLNEWGPEWYTNAPRALTQAHLDAHPTDDVREHVVVVQVLAHAVNRGYEWCYARRVMRVGTEPVRDFAHFVSLLEAQRQLHSDAPDAMVAIEMQTSTSTIPGNVVVLPVAQSAAADAEIQEAYHVRTLSQQ